MFWGFVAVKRKLWISDGMYSIHVVLLPEDNVKAIMDSSSTEAALPGTVVEVVSVQVYETGFVLLIRSYEVFFRLFGLLNQLILWSFHYCPGSLCVPIILSPYSECSAK